MVDLKTETDSADAGASENSDKGYANILMSALTDTDTGEDPGELSGDLVLAIDNAVDITNGISLEAEPDESADIDLSANFSPNKG